MLCARAAAISILSRPTPSRPTTPSLGAPVELGDDTLLTSLFVLNSISMCRSQGSHNHSYYAQAKGHEKCQVYAVEEESKRGRELAHAPAIDEDLHHSRHGYGTQGQREDNGDAEHLSRVVQHTEDTCGGTSRVWFD